VSLIEPAPDVPRPQPVASTPPPGASPRLIGAFVLVAVLIALGGLAALSSRNVFTSYRVYAVFFPNAVGGLKAGAPVTFRQVPLGSVRDVDLVFTGTNVHDSRIMAIIEIPRGRLRNVTGYASTVTMSDTELAQVLIEGGLRASVRSSSPIAGQRSVDLDFHPEVAPRFARFPSRYPELPTAPTGFELLNDKLETALQKVSDVPLDEVLVQIQSTLGSVQRLLDQGDIEAALRSLRTTLDTANRALARSDQTLGSVEAMSTDMRGTLKGVDGTMKSLQASLAQLDRTLATVDRNVERSAEVQHEAALALDETNELLKSMRILVETLQQHPESLVRGKPLPEEKK
jgi:phospholipid/cholesterol/gamma-HCH transport system substrate-binding protein